MAGYAVDTENKKSEEITDLSLTDVCNIYFEQSNPLKFHFF